MSSPPGEEAPPRNHRNRRLRRLIGILALLLVVDLARAPQRQLSARVLLLSIHAYQATLSPLMPRLGVRCRFTPSCSHYAAGVVEKYGAFEGTLLAAWRVLRCGPWTPAGTSDPP